MSAGEYSGTTQDNKSQWELSRRIRKLRDSAVRSCIAVTLSRCHAVDLILIQSASFEIAHFCLTVVTGNETTAKNTNPKRQRGKNLTSKEKHNLLPRCRFLKLR